MMDFFFASWPRRLASGLLVYAAGLVGILLLTWKLTVLSFVPGFLLGMVVAVLRLLPLPPLRFVLTVYVEIFRNIPSVALLVFIASQRSGLTITPASCSAGIVRLAVAGAGCDFEVARNRELFRQRFSKGHPQGGLEKIGAAPNRRGTSVSFTPDTAIFGEQKFKPARLYRLARSKAYLFRGVEIRWKCAASLASEEVPAEAVFQFPGGLADHLTEQVGARECVTTQFFSGSQDFPGEEQGRVEWAVAWPDDDEGFVSTYCNTIPTPQGRRCPLVHLADLVQPF